MKQVSDKTFVRTLFGFIIIFMFLEKNRKIKNVRSSIVGI